MTTPNPYKPPHASFLDHDDLASTAPNRDIKLMHDSFAALVLMHLVGCLLYGWSFFEMMRARVLHPLGMVLMITGGALLYAGAWRMRFLGDTRRRTFIMAGLGMALLLLFFRRVPPGLLLGLLGLLLGAAGYWLAGQPRSGELAAPEDGVKANSGSPPLAVYLIVIFCIVSISGIVLYSSQNWSGVLDLLQSRPLFMLHVIASPSLLLTAACWLFFLKKKAMIPFAMYLVLSVGQILALPEDPMRWANVFFCIAVLAYCARLLKRRVLH